MKKPLISVVMSAFNAEKFISAAVQSILNQTYTDFEFIIINDGSTDKTCEIIQSFADDRIVLIDKAKNAGLIIALNDGIKIAKGEYIARMDADDESLAERFELQIEFMQNNPDIDVLGTAMLLIDDHKTKIVNRPQNHQQCLDALNCGNYFFHATVMIRVNSRTNIKYDEKYPYAEDYKLWVDLAKNGVKFSNLQTPLLKYNWHSDNISIKKSDEQKKSAKMAQKAYLRYFFGNDLKKELDYLALNKTASLQVLSAFYGKLNNSKKKSLIRFFRSCIHDNINAIKFSWNVNFKILIYYFRYKLKDFFEK